MEYTDGTVKFKVRRMGSIPDEINAVMDTKQDKLTFDSTPTAGSGNPVTSSGIKSSVDNLNSAIDDVKKAIANVQSGVIDGDVSNPKAWWVKIGGVIPIIIQGGYNQVQTTVTFPVAFKSTAYSVIATLADDDYEAAQTWDYTATSFHLHQRYSGRWAHWVAIGLG